MIIRPRLGFWHMLIARHGTVLEKIWQPLLVLGLWSAAVGILHRDHPHLVSGHAPGPYTLIGVALSIFFSFRNNACYERWWEGRRQWGALVAATRHFARQTLILEHGSPGERQALIALAIAFCHALVAHLRPGYGLGEAQQWLLPAESELVQTARNRPDAILRLIARRLATLQAKSAISDISFQMLDRTVQDFASVQGACERIRATPVPFSYNQLLQRTTFLFLLVLPLGFVDILGATAIIIAELLIAYVFLGLDVLGDELEQPFGEEPNNLPIAALGETDLPPAPQPSGYVLL